MTRDQARSLWLNRAVAERVLACPDAALAKARDNLVFLRSIHTRGQAAGWLADWDRLLNGPVAGVIEVLTSPSDGARELRQNSPFAGLLTQEERTAVLRSFYAVSA